MYETQAELEAFLQHFYQVRFVRRLGEGAFGIAILVYDAIEQIHKVFKLPRNRATTEALIHEGLNLRRLRDLSHPNIIQLYQFGAIPMEWQGGTEDRYYINMAYGGTSLRAKLGRLRYDLDDGGNATYSGSGGRLPLEEVLRIAIDICRGLEAAHGFRGAPVRMLHRDISPDNILIDDDTGVARLSDFGIARVLDRSSALASFAGKLIYMDPFCFRGQASFHSDLYSLAIVLYEAATGSLPFATFPQRLEGPPKPPHEVVPELPLDFSAILLRVLANDLSARYETSNALLADLCALQARLNPLPARYVRIAPMEDGRVLCEDREGGGQVAVRLVASSATPADLRVLRARLESLGRPDLELYIRDFRNEQFLGVVGPVPPDPSLTDLCGRPAGIRPEHCPTICEAMAAVCDLLDAAHRVGVCHGFLSPYAVSLPPGGPRVHELGLAPLFRGEVSGDGMSGSVKGQHAYMSPRMLAGGNEPSPSDDVYSVGAILYCLFAGVPPACSDGGDPAPARTPDAPPVGALIDRAMVAVRPFMAGGSKAGAEFLPVRAAEEPTAPCRPLREICPVVPNGLAGIVGRCLARDPRHRPSGTAEVATVLRAVRWPEDAVEALVDDALRLFPPGASADALVEACDRIQIALHLDPGNPRAHFARGLVYLRNASYAFAVEEFTKSARVSPGFDIFFRLGEAHDHLGQPGAAAAAYRKALEHGDSPEIRLRLAELCPPPAVGAPRPPGQVAGPTGGERPDQPGGARASSLDSCARCGVAIPDSEGAVAGSARIRVCRSCDRATLKAPLPPWAATERGCAGCGCELPRAAGNGGPRDGLCDQCWALREETWTRLSARGGQAGGGPPALRGYELVRELGRGGMGAVYLARHAASGDLVALKVMLPTVTVGSRARDYFLREVENTRVLKHPHTVEMLHASNYDGIFFFTMEYCSGGCLDSLIRSGGPLPVERATALILQALSGLDYAHRVEIPYARRPDGSVGPGRGLVHRDIKPSNLFLADSGNSQVVKVGDFGLAKAFGTAGMSGQTATGMIAGTPKFMSRQQAQDFKYAEPAVDVWAMAATYYYLLTGQSPRDFPADRGTLGAVLTTDPVPIAKRCPAIPTRLAEVIDIALVDRPAIAVKTATALAELIRSTGVGY